MQSEEMPTTFHKEEALAGGAWGKGTEHLNRKRRECEHPVNYFLIYFNANSYNSANNKGVTGRSKFQDDGTLYMSQWAQACGNIRTWRSGELARKKYTMAKCVSVEIKRQTHLNYKKNKRVSQFSPLLKQLVSKYL